ncbi:MAG: hypothetical protein L3J28_14550 [Candidatus Polarisedimenticolaceae bacterium]|nr:hypothetical protein [Candidatus Polarisedimenticolaceae bacterium]
MNVSNYEFLKVEDFFEEGGYRGWSTLGQLTDYELIENEKVSLKCRSGDGTSHTILLHFPSPDTLRFRFDPAAEGADFYPKANSRAIVGDSDEHVSTLLGDVTVELEEEGNLLNILIKKADTDTLTMKLAINRDSYSMSIYKPLDDGSMLKVHGDAATAIYYKKRICYCAHNEQEETYSVIQAKEMPGSAKYVGFGEKGGYDLIRNGARLTYFNFDNMRYQQIYHNGPLDIREPLYDSNPFFMEVNRYPDQHSTYGIFLDNTSESFIDLGTYNHDEQYLIGTMYGTMDYYFFMGRKCAEVLKRYYSFVGTTRLKPRYVLGNHQGSYGYENLYDLQDVVNGYRGNNIPLDGLHVDVDIQQNYSTFTMNEDKFPSYSFDQLASQGIKCSTNITPVISYINENYKTFESGNKNGCFVRNEQVGSNGDNTGYYEGGVYYGTDPGARHGRGTFGHYPDFGRMETRMWWGQQYRLLFQRGLEMVWQDMTTPAIPDPKENWDVEIWSDKDNRGWKIGEKITSSSRSFPFGLLVTDNSQKKYAGETTTLLKRGKMPEKSPAAKIRNLYSYNLHKATYHGLNYLWYVNVYSFTVLGSEGITTEASQTIIDSLSAKGILSPVNKQKTRKTFIYQVDNNINYDDPNLDLGIPEQYEQYRNEITHILKQSVEIEKRRKNRRNFIIGRGGFTGMHRFAGLWTGDNTSSWDFLKINISQVLALGIAGQSMSGQDIGGFEREESWQQWVDPELFIRWISAGAFLPWFRNHYIQKGQKLFQEPYKFQDHIDQAPEQDRMTYRAVLPTAQYYVQLRYQLMQLFYDCMFENTLHEYGLPLVRPMFITDDHDYALFNDKQAFLNNQYFVGNDLLVAPVLDKESRGGNGWRDIYLPVDNKWYAFKNNRQKLNDPVTGGSTIPYDAHISDDSQHIPFILPMYVREGAIIPTIEIEQYVGERHAQGDINPVTLNIYPGYKCEYRMYQDDGVSRSSAPAVPLSQGGDSAAQGEYRKTIIRHDKIGGQRIIELKWTHNNYKPVEAFCFIALLHDSSDTFNPLAEIQKESSNFANNQNGVFRKISGNNDGENANALWNSSDDAWYYNENLHISFIKMFFNPELATLNTKQRSITDDTPEAQAPTTQIKLIKTH